MKRRSPRLRRGVVVLTAVALLATLTTFKHPTVLNNAPPIAAPVVADPANQPEEVDASLLRLADLVEEGWADWSTVADFYDQLDATTIDRLTRQFPDIVGNLGGAPFTQRIEANRMRLHEAIEESTLIPGPQRPWHGQQRPPREDLAKLPAGERQLIGLDLRGNKGNGSWIELVGRADAANVVVMVPGGSAYISSDNFDRYYLRARTFVEEADDLAVFIWAQSPSPAGWIQESFAAWSQRAADEVSAFVGDVRRQAGDEALLTLAGHSYGGATIGLAEKHDLQADRVVHIASPGTGHGVSSPDHYSDPCRERFSMTAPGDPISYVQGLWDLPMVGHGAHPDHFPGMVRLETGKTPDWPGAVDDIGRDLVELGISGSRIEGTHSHSEIFIPYSDAWYNLLAVFVGDEVQPHPQQPQPWPGCS
ncbi:alpha/beta hydrolase [Natronoglycomyces albus]|uniref:DUF1023 domain-containing protein n=1 Tax=Natronoglycomyces albus TaxID=2811108 RepID=A0A895XLI4_9ACTN|nr:alpha/beta hydrolase [Natronoglycomyces albus]QSB04279.1 hypothetical protein JQS30_10755 [Natronoglycomyces albus]